MCCRAGERQQHEQPMKTKKYQVNAKRWNCWCYPILPDEVKAERFAESSGWAKRHEVEKADSNDEKEKEKEKERREQRHQFRSSKDTDCVCMSVCVRVWARVCGCIRIQCTHFWNINIPMTIAADIKSAMIHIKQYSSGLWKKAGVIMVFLH